MMEFLRVKYEHKRGVKERIREITKECVKKEEKRTKQMMDESEGISKGQQKRQDR